MWLALPVSLGFIAMGVVALAAPARVLQTFGVTVGTPEGRTEVRAVYGGFGIAIGAVLIVALANESIRDGSFVAVAVALAGMAAGRVLSASIGERAPLWPTWTFAAIEAAGTALLVVAAAL